MKTKVLFCISVLFSITAALGQGTVFTYQGRVTDNGSNFSGSGQFKFALVTSTNFNHQATATAVDNSGFITSYVVTSGGSGYTVAPTVTISGGGGSGAVATANISGGSVTSITVNNPGSGYTTTPTVIIAPPPPNISYTTFWSNDGTSVAGSEPSAAVNVTVNSGLFTVALGDASQPNMTVIPSSLFAQPNLQLRMWFNDGANGFAALSPVQNVTPAPYAVFANSTSNLLGTLPAAQLSGPILASQLPSAAVTNNETSLNLSGTFSGSYSGNGGGLTNVGGALPWQVVSGTAQQAQPNTGYVLANNSLVTVALPTAPNIGDITRVSGSGAGGWKIAQNANQFVSSGNLSGNIGVVWAGRDTTRNWQCLVSSADGTKLFAAVNADHIRSSSDSGVTWLALTNSSNAGAVASSADGIKLVATDGGYLYTSTNSGANWQSRLLAPGLSEWSFCVASSADGSKLLAANYSGPLYTSSDSGATWTPQTNGIANGGNQPWSTVASSADGTKLIAGVTGSGPLYTSANSGVTWAARTNGIGNGGSQTWASVASSADGSKLVAAALSGQIYTSTDSGATWTARDSSRAWISVACSADGSKLVAVVQAGQIYTSVDSGATWTAHDSNRPWNCVASSADGTKLVAAVYAGQIYTSVPSSVSSTTSGITGYLLGSPNSAIELQFVGNGQFLPLSHEGIIQSF